MKYLAPHIISKEAGQTDDAINKKVSALYGLTEEKLKVVEGIDKNKR